MSKEKSAISVFQKYLTVWVILCMAIGILIGKFLPQIPDFLNRFEYAKVSIPMAIIIWLMIYPMMMKVDFQSINYTRTCNRISCRSRTSWCSSLHGHGICMEQSDKRRSGIHCSSGSYQRSDYSCCFYSDCEVSAGSIQCFRTVGYFDLICDIVRCYSACRRYADSIHCNKEKRKGVF